jgi:hypothetical protein
MTGLHQVHIKLSNLLNEQMDNDYLMNPLRLLLDSNLTNLGSDLHFKE